MRICPALSTASSVILDLRLNNGGDALKSDELFRSLVAFDVRDGRIAVLTGRTPSPRR